MNSHNNNGHGCRRTIVSMGLGHGLLVSALAASLGASTACSDAPKTTQVVETKHQRLADDPGRPVRRSRRSGDAPVNTSASNMGPAKPIPNAALETQRPTLPRALKTEPVLLFPPAAGDGAAASSSSEPVDLTVKPREQANQVTSEPVDLTVGPHEQANQAGRSVQKRTESEAIAGYVEWLRNGVLIADGQRIRWDKETRATLGRLPTVASVPLGYEIKVKGVRNYDGTLLAQQLDVKPNGVAAYESEVRQMSDAFEAAWTSRGVAYFLDDKGNRLDVGRIVESGPDVERARRILNRLVPPYVSASRLRVRVIQTNVWNASAMENGAIWVYKGLLDDVSDDELAAVLGHELAHYTHEHVRRGTRNGALVQLAALGAQAAIDGMQGSNRSAGLALVASLSLSAWRNRYSRGLEDQADRVGLRYAHEAGYDVTAAVRLWKRVREQKGEADPVSNFFGGDHSRPTDRIKNIERELLLNYTPTAGQ